jgi:hypothetical protein
MSAAATAAAGPPPAASSLGATLLKGKVDGLCSAFASEAKALDIELSSLLQRTPEHSARNVLDAVGRIAALNAEARRAVLGVAAHQAAHAQLAGVRASRSAAVHAVRDATAVLHACREDLTEALAKTERLADAVHGTEKRKLDLPDVVYMSKRLRYTVAAPPVWGAMHFQFPTPMEDLIKSRSLRYHTRKKSTSSQEWIPVASSEDAQAQLAAEWAARKQ